MKGIVFLDENFKPVNLPKPELCKKDYAEWYNFISKCKYVYFAIPERMQWFKDMYKEYDDMNSIFGKVCCDVYTYDPDDDYWSREMDRKVTTRVYQEYIVTQKLVGHDWKH